MLVVCLIIIKCIFAFKSYYFYILHTNFIKLQVSLVDEGKSGQSEDCMTPSPERPEALAEEYM